MFVRTISLNTVALVLIANCTFAEELSDKPVELSSIEKELVDLIEEFKNELSDFWSQSREIGDYEEQKLFRRENDPAASYLPRLLEFEEKHRGQDVCINALREIVDHAGRGGSANSPAVFARREALKRLPPYEGRILAAHLVVRLSGGRYDPQVVDYVRQLGSSTKAHPSVSAIARYTLAKALLNQRDSRKHLEEYLEKVVAGKKPQNPRTEEYIHEMLAELPPQEKLDQRAKEAVDLLTQLTTTGQQYSQPRVRGKDPKWRIRVLETDSENPPRYLSKIAEALLFKENHLRVSKQLPELNLELVSGDLWSTSKTLGRVVVIQFSFTGCSPCMAMYPDLRELHETYPDQLSIVTIMSDKTDQHIQQSIETGTLTWSIFHDGSPGKIATKWAVYAFPTIYVIDKQGTIVATNLRGEDLKAKVAELVAVEG